MKNILKYYTILLTGLLFFTSCSDKLTESKVEDLISNCDKKPLIITKSIFLGESYYTKTDEINNFKKLNDKKIINFNLIEDGIFKKYNVSIPQKNQKYIYKIEKTKNKNNIASIVLCNLKIEEILLIQEIPSMNIANVKVKFKKIDKTPFFDYFNDKSDFIEIDFILKKTENKDWVYCY